MTVRNGFIAIRPCTSASMRRPRWRSLHGPFCSSDAGCSAIPRIRITSLLKRRLTVSISDSMAWPASFADHGCRILRRFRRRLLRHSSPLHTQSCFASGCFVFCRIRRTLRFTGSFVPICGRSKPTCLMKEPGVRRLRQLLGNTPRASRIWRRGTGDLRMGTMAGLRI